MAQSIAALAGRPVIIGAGLAGLMTALELAPRPVVVLAKAPLGSEAASAWAQGGISAALASDDSAALHAADTCAAGAGLSDVAVTERVTKEATAVIERLARLGVAFDRDAQGGLALGLEAAHSKNRIVHAGGDASGRLVMQALIQAVARTDSIHVLDSVDVRRLVMKNGAVCGVLACAESGNFVLPSSCVVLASGGSGTLYQETTNPRGAIGTGLALAARAGARLADMEFVQFHPSALDCGCDPMPLISEAVRGEGAQLIDENGVRFMAGEGRAELEPRDVVTRAIARHAGQGHTVFLDARKALGPRFASRFPTITVLCRQAGIDPAVEPIPIKPAAHYHMGGVAVDIQGRSSVAGLWACGEAASTGLHGANRLASNSLLEAVVYGRIVAQSIAGREARTTPHLPPVEAPPYADASEVRTIMSRHVGIVRDQRGLAAAVEALLPLAFGQGSSADPALAGLFIAVAALLREESRGAHYRSDFPHSQPEQAQRRMLDIGELERLARESVSNTKQKL
ncbi:MAG: L-aspartate oxidase [Rhodanobacter sp.]|jgi:L-aspartate oxidase|nr:L-aspartate oxidase [Rhodanobacter sp.]